MKCIFSFIWYKSYIYLLIFWILEIFMSISNYYISNIKSLESDLKEGLNNEYIELLSLNLADLLAGFFVIYTKCSFQKNDFKKLSKGKSITDIKLIYKNNPINLNKKLCLLILISVLDLISRSSYFWFYLLCDKVDSIKIKLINKNERVLNGYQTDFLIAIDILFRYLFSRLILKTKLYRHHLLAIIISVIGFLVISTIDIISIINDEDNISVKLLFILFILSRPIFFPLADVINKILLSKAFLLPHTLMFDRGLIEFTILLIISLILFLTNSLDISYESNIIYIILIKFGFTIIYFIKAFCLMQVIYNFTSQYVSFLVTSESLAGTLNLIIMIIKNSNSSDSSKFNYPKIYHNNSWILFFEILSLLAK